MSIVNSRAIVCPLRCRESRQAFARNVIDNVEHAEAPALASWPAPGSEDTELGVLMELEVCHGATEVHARQAGAVAPNVLDRTFEAAAPNSKWIADFTYVWTAEGWRYVAAVIDLFSRRVVGLSMSAAMTGQLVTDALVMAIWRRGKPDALLHHSDRGSQYTSEQFQRLMADNGVVCSMSRSGNVWDKAAMESFFSSLKTERTGNKTYRTEMRPEQMCSITSNASTTQNAGTRRSAI